MHSVAASADLDGWRAQVCLSALLSLGGTPCDFVRLRKSSTPRASSAVLVKLEVRRTGDSGGGAPAAADGSSPAIWLGRDALDRAQLQEGDLVEVELVRAAEVRLWAEVHVSAVEAQDWRSPLALPTATDVRAALGVVAPPGGGRIHPWRSDCLGHGALVHRRTPLTLRAQASQRAVCCIASAVAPSGGEAGGAAGGEEEESWGWVGESTPVRLVACAGAEATAAGGACSGVSRLLLFLHGVVEAGATGAGAGGATASPAGSRCGVPASMGGDGAELAASASPVLLAGSRGVGKTALVRRLCRSLGLLLLEVSPHELCARPCPRRPPHARAAPSDALPSPPAAAPVSTATPSRTGFGSPSLPPAAPRPACCSSSRPRSWPPPQAPRRRAAVARRRGSRCSTRCVPHRGCKARARARARLERTSGPRPSAPPQEEGTEAGASPRSGRRAACAHRGVCARRACAGDTAGSNRLPLRAAPSQRALSRLP